MERGGRAQAVTIISPSHRWWSWWLHLTWPGAERWWLLSWFIKRPLVELSFIHFAHWSLVSRMPPRARPFRARRLPHPYILFQSNFNDDLDAYIDAFALIVPWRMRGMWHGTFRFPGPRPVDRFLQFISQRTTPDAHYFCAYPEASSTMIKAALALADRHRRFEKRASRLDDAAFARSFGEFVTENQKLL